MRITSADFKKLGLDRKRKVVGISRQQMANDLDMDVQFIAELELEELANEKLSKKIKEGQDEDK
jgi:ribosome-binding protein aMBF1 (putative translation factor)